MPIVAVVQARTGSTRLPGKVLEPVGGRPLVLWTMEAVAAVPSIDHVVAAIPAGAQDDRLEALLLDAGWTVHRGPARDVLTRCWEAVVPYAPGVVVRETADNPFVDPAVVEAQVRRLVDEGDDYLGTTGWPLGIAAEVARAQALAIAYAEATAPAEREHVMPFLYTRPGRFRVGVLEPAVPLPPGRFTVDTERDLAFARAIADRLDRDAPPTIEALRRIVTAEPALLELNRDVRQKSWQEAER